MSRQSDTVDVWLKELASLAGIDSLALNPQGVCAVRFGDRAEIVLELPDPSEVLHLYCAVCPIPPDEKAAAALYRHALELNMFGLETRGASFAVDRESERLLLCYTLPLAGTDIVAFQNTIGNFAQVCDRFCQDLNEASPGESSPDPDDRSNYIMA